MKPQPQVQLDLSTPSFLHTQQIPSSRTPLAAIRDPLDYEKPLHETQTFVILRGAKGAVAESMSHKHLTLDAPQNWILRLQSLRSLRAG